MVSYEQRTVTPSYILADMTERNNEIPLPVCVVVLEVAT